MAIMAFEDHEDGQIMTDMIYTCIYTLLDVGEQQFLLNLKKTAWWARTSSCYYLIPMDHIGFGRVENLTAFPGEILRR